TGRRLADELGKPSLTPARALRLATQLLEGLRHGHAYGVVHRELGPDKIWLSGNANAPDHVKILDFGLARISGDDKKRTAANAFGCLAPEQLQARTVDQRADLFAVGVMLRAMASGQTLPASDAGGRALTPALQRVVARAVAKDPEQRFADAGEFLDELEAMGEGRTPKRRKVAIAAPPRLGRAAGFALAALVVVVAGGVGWWARARQARRAAATVTTAAPPPVVNAPPTVVNASPTVVNTPPPVVNAPPTVVNASPTVVNTPAPVVNAPPTVVNTPPPVASAPPRVAEPPAAKSVVENAPAAKPMPGGTAPAPTKAAAPTKTAAPTVETGAAKTVATAAPIAAKSASPPNAVVATKPAPASPTLAKPTPAVVPATAAAKPANVVATAQPAAKNAAIAAPAAAPPAATNEPAPAGESARVTALLSAGKLDVAEQELRAQLDLHAESAELHFLLGEVFFRKFWRRDAIVEWDRALALDPSLRRDPRLTTRLCTTLGARWRGAGAELITKRFAADAVPLLRGCVATATDRERLTAAAQLAEQLGGPSAIDPQLVARRTQELSPPAAPQAPPKAAPQAPPKAAPNVAPPAAPKP
ncbi:MAG TPA: protein kinase, partial [Polyangia bacterium]|nr:protein kinase [Polyangia bacterium]